ncbi:MAG: phytoene synthase [Planctomycetota bacterium]|jgi:phytoene synthase
MATIANDIEISAKHCRDITRRSATSFYYAFKTLPRRKARAFEIIYAFMRVSDDLSDDETIEDRVESLENWRACLKKALAGDTSHHPIMPALIDVLNEFEIPPNYLHELIDGTVQDLTVTRFEDFEALHDYCYKVASIVGLVSLRIFRLKEPTETNWARAEKLAIDCGQGFQLTNILRDIKEDWGRDRVYLPQEDLRRFEITEADLDNEIYDGRFLDFMYFQCERAEDYYTKSEALLELIERDARPCLATMRGIYHGILLRIETADYDIWSRRARVPLGAKLGIAARAFLDRFRG